LKQETVSGLITPHSGSLIFLYTFKSWPGRAKAFDILFVLNLMKLLPELQNANCQKISCGYTLSCPSEPFDLTAQYPHLSIENEFLVWYEHC
jgi:hypothetical protein